MKMTLGDAISYLLAESRVDDAKKKYPNLSKEVDFLASHDPSGNNKYLPWMIKQVASGEDAKEVSNYVKKFHSIHNRLKRRDINQYSLKSLKDELTKSDETSNRKMREEIKSGGKIVYEDNDVTVYYMQTPESCVYYGKGTKWCITSPKDGRKAWGMYKSTDEGISQFYFIIRKSPKGDVFDKVAIKFPSMENEEGEDKKFYPEFFDSADDDIQQRAVREHIPSLPKIMSVIQKDAYKRPDEFQRIHMKHDNSVQKPEYYRVQQIIQFLKTHVSNIDNDDLWAVIQTLNDRIDPLRADELTDWMSTLPAEIKSKILLGLPVKLARLISGKFVNDSDQSVSDSAKIAALQDLDFVRNLTPEQRQKTLESAVQSKNPDVRFAAAKSVALWRPANLELSELLTNDPDERIRAETLRHLRFTDRLSEMHMDAAAHDSSPLVRQRLAALYYQDKLPTEIIDILVNDTNDEVRAAAASIYNLSVANMEKLARDPNPEVRKNVLYNSRFPEHLQSLMLNDPDPTVSKAAKKLFSNHWRDGEFRIR